PFPEVPDPDLAAVDEKPFDATAVEIRDELPVGEARDAGNIAQRRHRLQVVHGQPDGAERAAEAFDLRVAPMADGSGYAKGDVRLGMLHPAVLDVPGHPVAGAARDALRPVAPHHR